MLPSDGPSGKIVAPGHIRPCVPSSDLQEWNSQARPFPDQSLEPVQKLGLLAGALEQNRVGQT